MASAIQGLAHRSATMLLLALALAAGVAACSRQSREAAGPDAARAAAVEPISAAERRLLRAARPSPDIPVPAPSPQRLLAGIGSGQPAAFVPAGGGAPPHTVMLDVARPRIELPPQSPVEGFLAKLRALESGERTKPVVILHVGDSHVASDSFTRGVRQRLQARFGDAGRGPVVPAAAFKYAAAQAVSLDASGGWTSSLSLKSGNGVYGVSGVRVEAGSPGAVMTLQADKPFDHASVTVVTGPGRGDFTVEVDGSGERFSSSAATASARTFRIGKGGRRLAVRPVGNGKVSLLHWSTGRDRPGIRYVNFGQVGATVDVTRRWDEAALRNDIETIRPDLIVYGFGTNEGFNDNVKPSAYRAYAEGFIGKLQSYAPDAAVAIIGAADGLRRKGGASCGNGWARPPKLDAIRAAMRDLADDIGALWWDWSQAMGGACSIDRWSRQGLAAGDRVHLTSKGYDRSAQMFYDALTAPLDASKQLASAN